MTSLLLDALAGRPCARPPIWLMRQAGRYLPEYRKIRAEASSFLELCYTPDLAVEITLQPIRRYGFDAAILFSDIFVLTDALGGQVTYVEGEGPRLEPVRTAEALRELSLARLHERLAPVYETVQRVRAALPGSTALIGFAAAPWTLAAYMVEGVATKEFHAARTLARTEPDLFQGLIDLITESTSRYLAAQIQHGAQAIQLFDSWAGLLPEPEFQRWCVAPAASIVATLKQNHPDVPVIAFPRGAGALYPAYLRAVSVDGLGLDTTVPLTWALDSLKDVCLQGNLDPVALLAGGETMLAEARRILDLFADRPFIFNLGHGVLPGTNPDSVATLVDLVKASS